MHWKNSSLACVYGRSLQYWMKSISLTSKTYYSENHPFTTHWITQNTWLFSFETLYSILMEITERLPHIHSLSSFSNKIYFIAVFIFVKVPHLLSTVTFAEAGDRVITVQWWQTYIVVLFVIVTLCVGTNQSGHNNVAFLLGKVNGCSGSCVLCWIILYLKDTEMTVRHCPSG